MSTGTKVAYLERMRSDLIAKLGHIVNPEEDGPREFQPQPYADWRKDKEKGLPCFGCGKTPSQMKTAPVLFDPYPELEANTRFMSR